MILHNQPPDTTSLPNALARKPPIVLLTAPRHKRLNDTPLNLGEIGGR